jgi:predicted nucleic acid-binding protein
LSRGSDRLVFLELLQHLQNDTSTTIVAADATLFRLGVALFASRPDKEWSLVDCISMAVMKQRRLKDALTADRHFVQAGFVAAVA